MQRIRDFEMFFILLGLLILVGAGICGINVPGSPTAGGFAITGGLCFVAAAIMYTRSDTKKAPTPPPAKPREVEEAAAADTDIRTEPK
jgi:hypothetical protein